MNPRPVLPFCRRPGAARPGGLGRDRSGSVAVEFALLAVPFLALIYAIFETSLVHMTGQVLQSAVTDASRLIMTGQAQSKGLTQSQFKAEICKKVTVFFNCSRDLQVDVQVYSSFTGASVTTPPIDAKGNLDTSAFKYDAGQPNSIVIVRAAVAYPIVVPLIGKTMVNLSGNKLLIMASAAFKNEPFSASP
jgi:Flp pilus assembly protein TadG